jgi:hypothetical protein
MATVMNLPMLRDEEFCDQLSHRQIPQEGFCCTESCRSPYEGWVNFEYPISKDDSTKVMSLLGLWTNVTCYINLSRTGSSQSSRQVSYCWRYSSVTDFFVCESLAYSTLQPSSRSNSPVLPITHMSWFPTYWYQVSGRICGKFKVKLSLCLIN